MYKVLIVDDEMTSRVLISNMVQPLGCTPIFAKNGQRAWHILEDNHDIRCVITDYAMPEGDGIELVRKIQKAKNMQNVKVMITSAYISVNDIKQILEEGVVAFCPKPLKKKDVQEWILKLVHSTSPHPQNSN